MGPFSKTSTTNKMHTLHVKRKQSASLFPSSVAPPCPPGNNLSGYPVYYSKPTNGRLFCPLKPMATYYEATAMAHSTVYTRTTSHPKAGWFVLPCSEPKLVG